MVAPHQQRQRIVVAHLSLVRTAEEIKRDDDAIAAMLCALDCALEANRIIAKMPKHSGIQSRPTKVLTLMVSLQPHAEYAAMLWASANGLSVAERISKYDTAGYIGESLYGQQIRSLDIILDGEAIASVQFDAEPIDKEPRVITDADQMWAPHSDGAA